MSSIVSRTGVASSEEVVSHFKSLLKFETDCWDVHFALTNQRSDFILLDVRGELMYNQSHIEGAESLPTNKINEESLSKYPQNTLFVVYCAGPHCNATEKAAIKLAQFNRPVKKMIGGITGWIDEGFELFKPNK